MNAYLFSIDPEGRGGTYSALRFVYECLERWGMTPRIHYLCGGPGEGLSPRELIGDLRLWGGREQARRGLRGFAFGHVAAHWPWLAFNWWPYPVVRRALGRGPSANIVVGLAAAGMTPAVLRKPLVSWIFTLHGDELAARTRGGEAGAARLLRSPGWALLRAQERFVLRRSHRILAISNYTARRICEDLPDVADRVHVLGLPVDTDVFRPDSDEAPGHAPTAIAVGRWDDARKGIDVLLATVREAKRSVPDLRLRLVGAGAERAAGIARRTGLNGAVAVLGHLRQTELVRELQAADLFILPSRQEGLGIAAMEAMACGLPVVSTRCGGPEDFVIEGETGYLVPPDDPASLAAAAVRVLRSPGERQAMGVRSRRLVVESRSRPVVERALLEVMRKVYPCLRL